jgi:broad-specificity NMP kinase
MKELHIDISGTVGCGKTVMAFAIEKLLVEYNIRSTVVDDEQYDSAYENSVLDGKLKSISHEDIHVIIKTHQLQRNDGHKIE